MEKTAEEYVSEQIGKNKEFYKTPNKMINEQIKLLRSIQVHFKDDIEKQWRLAVAVSEAYHVVLWDIKNEQAKRLINTIFSFVKNNVV